MILKILQFDVGYDVGRLVGVIVGFLEVGFAEAGSVVGFEGAVVDAGELVVEGLAVGDAVASDISIALKFG